MKKFYFNNFILINLIGLLCFFVFLSVLIHNKEFGSDHSSVERIKKTGVLRLITNNSINTYYYYNGKPTGFEYDLAREFANFLNVDLDIVTPGWNNMFSYLEQGKGDFIAAGLAITKDRLEKVNFSIPYMTIQQHIVHHKLVFGPKNIEDLTFRTIHVRRGTSYQSRLEEIKKSGIDLNYILHDNIPTEELIRMVNDREIKFTVADNNIAYLNQRYYPDIRIGIPIQEKESLAWAVNKNDPQMLEQINKFFLYANQTGILKQISDKYYANIVLPYSSQVKKALDAVSVFEVDMIAPSHGVIWRKHINEIIEHYKNNSKDDIKHLEKVLNYLKLTLEKPPQPGSTNIFWKNLYLSFPRKSLIHDK
jgi:membrane-bound lytic murein transglycosylase F